MPVYPKLCVGLCDTERHCPPCGESLKSYRESLAAFKASSVPVDDQERAFELLDPFLRPIRQRIAKEKQANESFVASYGLDIDEAKGSIYGPFDIGYKLDEVFSHCTPGEKHYKKVAILFPEPVGKLEEKEEQDVIWREMIDIYDLVDASSYGYGTLIKKLKERFTITRKPTS